MPITNITKEALETIRSKAVRPFKADAKPQPDGTVNIDISDDVLARLKEHQEPGESLSDTINRVVNFSPDIAFGSFKKVITPTVIDAFYRSSFDNEAGGGWTSNAKWREAFTNARRFVLDDEMSTFLGELATAAFTTRSKAVAVKKVEHLRLGARLPFETTWVEYNLRNAMVRSHELLGMPFKPEDSPQREGWLLQQHPTIPTAIRAHILSYDASQPDEHGFNAWTFPVAFAWTVDTDTILPWRPLPFSDKGMRPSEVVTGIPGYISDRAGIVFSDMVNTPKDAEAVAGLIREWGGCVRRMWALLATIDDLPLKLMEVTPSRGFMARSNFRRYLHHKTITLTVPRSKYRKVVRTVLALAHRRAHGVRGHWRNDWRHPLSPLCEHEFTADEKHMTCKKCGGRKIWIPPHQRGDAGQGLTTHDYQIKHGDDNAHV